MSTSKLTVRQHAFVNEYLKDLNATQAAIRAGYATKGASVRGVELLTNRKIQVVLQQRMDERNKRCEVDQDYVLKRLVSIDQMDVLDIFTDDMAQIRPIKEWPPVWRQTISHIEVNELFDYMEGRKEQTGLMKKIKWPDKVKNLELLGRHTQVRCWDKDINLNSDGIEMHLHYG